MLAAAGAAELQTALIAHDSRRWWGVSATTVAVVAIVRIALRGARLLSHVGLVIIVFDLLPLVAGGVASIAVTRKRRVRTLSSAWQFAPGIAFALACITPGFPLERFASPLQMAELYGRQSALFAPLRPALPARVLSLLPFRGHGAWAKVGTYFEVPVLNDVEPLSLVDFRAYADALRGGAPADVTALPTVFMGEVAPPRDRYDSRLLNLAGVRFVVTDDAGVANVAKWFSDEVKLSAWARSGDQIVYENRAAFPRAFFVPSEDAHGATANCLDVLRSPGFDPATAVLLEESATSAPRSEPRGTASVAIHAYAPSEVRLAIASDASGFVVLTDAFYPGWTATIDGTDAPILRADCFFRAVRVTAGKHDITFRYTPRSFLLGSIVSGGALIAIVLTGIAQRRRPRP
jgi:Bacterial membrane protein YfhO